MNPILPLLTLALTLGAPAATAARTAHPLHAAHLPAVPGEVLVIADPGVLALGPSGDAPHAAAPALAEALRALGLEHLERLGPLPRVARREAWRLSSDRPGFDPAAAAAALRATGRVRAACPNVRLSPLIVPNDPGLSLQWSVGDVNLEPAWDVTRGDSSIVLAIMDTGLDLGHPEFAGRVWTNPGEIPGNGVDDDGNGLIDDVHGWDFGQNDADPNPEYTPEFVPDLGGDIDVGFHGTFCAGLAAAATNNGQGIAGADWRCRIMPLKVSHPDSGITAAAMASAFAYAADKGASVLSISLGGPGDPGVPEFFQALVDDALAAGILTVAAAGNDGDSIRSYPAACDHVLSVAATDDAGARASFSNFGSWVRIAAPGSTMWSTICRNYTFTDLDQIFYIYFFGWDGETPYMYGDGTSFACPLTAGVCTLVRAAHPTLTPLQVMQHVIAHGDAVPYDEPIGPHLNAYAAVSAPAAVGPAAAAARLALAAPAPNPARAGAAWGITLSARAGGAVTLELFDVDGRRIAAHQAGVVPAGMARLAWAPPVTHAGIYFLRARQAGETSAPVRVAVLE